MQLDIKRTCHRPLTTGAAGRWGCSLLLIFGLAVVLWPARLRALAGREELVGVPARLLGSACFPYVFGACLAPNQRCPLLPCACYPNTVKTKVTTIHTVVSCTAGGSQIPEGSEIDRLLDVPVYVINVKEARWQRTKEVCLQGLGRLPAPTDMTSCSPAVFTANVFVLNRPSRPLISCFFACIRLSRCLASTCRPWKSAEPAGTAGAGLLAPDGGARAPIQTVRSSWRKRSMLCTITTRRPT